MPHYMEIDGINVEKAIERACKELNITKEELKHDVISYGSSGIFGLVGTKKAKIRVTIPDTKTVSNEEIKEQEPINIGENNSETIVYEEKQENSYIETGLDILNRIIKTIADDSKASVKIEDNEINYEIDCSNPSVIIGKRGQTLDAIQYLIEKIVKKHNATKQNITVDISGYLNKKRIKLARNAEKMAEKAIANGKPMSLGQMNAYDRRIIHHSLKHNNEVVTHSVGEGFIKKLVIFPKKKRSVKAK
ncbi:MAG: Jag N-terminal domain-containing protein [Proteobacteria bacterium]|nr:Jag N-terminal domain-containing protein [Pseudomonadota bacterium]